MPFVSPVTTMDRVARASTLTVPHVAVYPVIPPMDFAALKLTFSWPLPGTTDVMTGAVGGATTVTAGDRTSPPPLPDADASVLKCENREERGATASAYVTVASQELHTVRSETTIRRFDTSRVPVLALTNPGSDEFFTCGLVQPLGTVTMSSPAEKETSGW